MGKIRTGAVSYLNTKPLLYGLIHSDVIEKIDLTLHYPSLLAEQLNRREIDLALLPVAAMPGIKGARIVGRYGIAADGDVASVALFSEVPLERIESVYLDYQSRTSVRLARILFHDHWKKEVAYAQAGPDYIASIKGRQAGIIIGDRALQQLGSFPYVYDLATAWKEMTGLGFVFAAWVATDRLPDDFIIEFDRANEEGINHIREVVAANPFPQYDLYTYFTRNIKYELTDDKLAGMTKFLSMIADDR